MQIPHVARAPKDEDFKSDGPRAFFAYADTGLAASTGGRYGASVVRTVKAVKPGDGTGWHYHEADLQLIYIVRGWAVLDYEGLGRTVLRAGDMVYQPRGARHDVVEVSEGYEHIEIDMPATFETIGVGKPAEQGSEPAPGAG